MVVVVMVPEGAIVASRQVRHPSVLGGEETGGGRKVVTFVVVVADVTHLRDFPLLTIILPSAVVIWV